MKINLGIIFYIPLYLFYILCEVNMIASKNDNEFSERDFGLLIIKFMSFFLLTIVYIIIRIFKINDKYLNYSFYSCLIFFIICNVLRVFFL